MNPILYTKLNSQKQLRNFIHKITPNIDIPLTIVLKKFPFYIFYQKGESCGQPDYLGENTSIQFIIDKEYNYNLTYKYINIVIMNKFYKRILL